MFDLKKFIALIGIEDNLMELFYVRAEAEGLHPTFDIYHILAGQEKPSEREILIMQQIYDKYIKGTAYENIYRTADVDFPTRLAEKNKRRLDNLKS